MRTLLIVIIVLAMTATAGSAGWDTDPNLVAWYKMNDNADSNTVIDSMGFSDGNSVRDTCDIHVIGKIGGALSFNGTSDYIEVSDTANLHFGVADFSICFWIKPDATIPNVNCIFYKEFEDNTGIIISIITTTGLGEVVLILENYPDSLGVISISKLRLSEWNFVAFSISRAGNGRVYLDSVLDNTVDVSSMAAVSFTSTENMILGANKYGIQTGNYINGSLDNVMIFNKELSRSEITSLYGGGFVKQKQNQYSIRRNEQ
jgi:hypothetical protein